MSNGTAILPASCNPQCPADGRGAPAAGSKSCAPATERPPPDCCVAQIRGNPEAGALEVVSVQRPAVLALPSMGVAGIADGRL